MLPISKVQNLILKHAQLEKELSSGEIDKKNIAEKSKEYSDLNEIIKEANAYKDFETNKKDLDKIINDSNSDKDIKETASALFETLKVLEKAINSNFENFVETPVSNDPFRRLVH